MSPAHWDAALFRLIHHGMHQPWLDPVMMWLTDPGPWKIPILALTGLLFLLRGRRGVLGVLVLALTLTVSDQLSSHVLKKMFRRMRPSEALADTNPLFGVRRTHSFPSTHAVNFFAGAPVIAAVFPGAAIAAYSLAGAVSFSRVYVGDHYPFDVLAGAGLGIFLGLLGRKAWRRLVRTLLPRGELLAMDRGPAKDPLSVSARGERAPSGGP